MILSKSSEDRAKALDKLLPHQKNDFIEIFKYRKKLFRNTNERTGSLCIY